MDPDQLASEENSVDPDQLASEENSVDPDQLASSIELTSLLHTVFKKSLHFVSAQSGLS